MPKHGKRYRSARELVDKTKVLPLDEAIELVKKTATAKFPEAVELHIKLGIDVKQSDQLVRGTVQLPHPTGQKFTIVVFTTPDHEQEATDAGATFVGGEELIKEIKTTKKVNFDVAIASPQMMPKLAPIAKILGQKGLMPNPKNETISTNIPATVKAILGGKVAFRADDSGNLHQIVGRVSDNSATIGENVRAYFDAVKRAKPAAVKANYVQSMTLTSSMGPGVRVTA